MRLVLETAIVACAAGVFFCLFVWLPLENRRFRRELQKLRERR